MLPESRFSDVPVPAALLPPDDQQSTPLIDFERGGIALNDPSQGHLVQNWKCFLAANGADVMLQAGESAPFVHFSRSGISELSLAFDQNMRSCVAFTADGNVWLRWYDPIPQAYTIASFGPGRNPRLTLDDKRASQLSVSDVILAYIGGGSLVYRQQRDRFTIPYVLRSGVDGSVRLKNIGMTRNLRILFETL